MVTVAGFGMCCGARLFTGWYDKVSDEKVKELCKAVTGIALVILNNKQVKTNEEVLLKHGFKILVDGFHNPIHPDQHGLTLYAYLSHPELLRPRSIKKEDLYQSSDYYIDHRFLESNLYAVENYFKNEPYEKIPFAKKVKKVLTKANDDVIKKVNALRGLRTAK